ncbi:MAG: hypothetical protein M1816_007834 [Peltula sp. TS41687]|nr:MAG: hypothetical protein M1816_007834 [Peltula sp. TS41687]
MSTTNPSHGTKVHGPNNQHIIREGAGPVTADSLAAESVRSGGGFAENRDSEPLKVKGANSTFNTTDTSAADELSPARDAAQRPGGSEEALSGLGKGYVAGAGAEKGGSGIGSGGVEEDNERHGGQGISEHGTTTTAEREGGGAGHEAGGTHTTGQQHHGHDAGKKHHTSGGDTSTHQAEAAPTYVKADVLDPPLHQKPKGRNLTEGGIEDDAPNASFTAEIGSEDDPGRLAERKFEAAAARSAGGGGPKDMKIDNNDQYNVLGEEEAP